MARSRSDDCTAIHTILIVREFDSGRVLTIALLCLVRPAYVPCTEYPYRQHNVNAKREYILTNWLNELQHSGIIPLSKQASLALNDVGYIAETRCIAVRKVAWKYKTIVY